MKWKKADGIHVRFFPKFSISMSPHALAGKRMIASGANFFCK